MATPSAAFPLSPSPQSPVFSGEHASLPQHAQLEERRQNKRSSTAAQEGRPDFATAYPSPPPNPTGPNRSRPAIDPSLVIPPFNPNKRRSAGGSTTGSSSSTPNAASRRSSTQQAFDERVANLMPSPPLPAAYQTTHAHAHAQRPASTAIVPSIPPFQPSPYQHAHGHPTVHGAAQGPGGSVSSRSRQSVGYMPASSSLAGQGPYPHLYTPHPMPKQRIYFGPYILLHTLGEGEFGKVKLGVHAERWGEDVAIKLIRRGNVDTAQRGEKVRREIEVLKMVRHPNIVRLYDVIETDKYIGIVLEYASGGELFDHILAHRYLKERDASRLFAQLISGVSYLHSKGVVHRDLKLENLLLDRNRNVIITDFGFANRFNESHVDLMVTSCGSPCYAAPELVVQDGKYVGTAVDVWSCGVILYAMLAGYLPYDDDPANPEGDNINLLYKYILSTPLIFPEWITEEPRHLLLCMLVPDPTKRCTIQDVARHSWLRKFAPAFDKTVEELEFQAQELEMQKRRALDIQRQWLIQQQQQQQMAAQGLLAPAMTRSQTATSQMGMSGPAAARHRSAMVTSASNVASAPLAQHGFEHYPSATPQPPTPLLEEPAGSPRIRTTSTTSASGRSAPSPSVIPGASNPSRRSGAYVVSSSPPTTQTEFVAAEAGPFSFETARGAPSASPGLASSAMVPFLSAPAATATPGEDQVMSERAPSMSRQNSASRPAASEAEDRRRKTSHRATLQVEYDAHASSRGSRREQVPPSPLSASGPIQGLAIHTEETAEEGGSPPMPSSAMLGIPPVHDARESASPSPVPSMGGVSISTTTETFPGEEVIMQPVEEEERPVVLEQAQPEPVVEKSEVEAEVTEESVLAQPEMPAVEERLEVEEQSVAEERPLPEAVPASENELSGVPARPSIPPIVPFPATPTATHASPTPDAPTSPSLLNGTPRKRKSSGSPIPSIVPLEQPIPTVPALPQPPAADAEAPPRAKISAASQSSAATQASRAPSASSNTSRHRHAPSADRFSIRQLLGGSVPNNDRSSRPSSRSETPVSQSGRETPLDEVTNRRKPNRRQKALSLQPFRNSMGAKPKQGRANAEGQIAASRNRSNTARQDQQPDMLPPPVPTVRPVPQPGWARPAAASITSSRRLSTDLEANWGTSGQTTPSGKAKAVMDWFRRKSTKGDGLLQPIPTDFDDRRAGSRPPSSLAAEAPASSNTSMRDGATTPTASAPSAPPFLEPVDSVRTDRAPSLVISSAGPQPESQPSSRTPSGAQSSQFSQTTTSTVATSVGSPTAPAAASSAPTFVPAKLRLHQGALDKNAVTYRVPTEVILEIKNVLWNMGVDMAMEGEFKIKCVRKSRKKAFAASNRVSHSPLLGNASVVAASGSLDRRSGLPSSPSMPQSPSMGFRSIFNRSGRSPGLSSSATLGTLPPATPTTPLHFDTEIDPLSSPMTSSVSQFSMLTLSSPQPMPVYGGEKSADGGDEVRFAVELTRVKNLDRMYCVDIKRLKGGPWSYKHVYEQLLGALDLGPTV
ncbi:hypothetical protein JCM11641_001473 [Rhodosporidiobolus odoratus]